MRIVYLSDGELMCMQSQLVCNWCGLKFCEVLTYAKVAKCCVSLWAQNLGGWDMFICSSSLYTYTLYLHFFRLLQIYV